MISLCEAFTVPFKYMTSAEYGTRKARALILNLVPFFKTLGQTTWCTAVKLSVQIITAGVGVSVGSLMLSVAGRTCYRWNILIVWDIHGLGKFV